MALVGGGQSIRQSQTNEVQQPVYDQFQNQVYQQQAYAGQVPYDQAQMPGAQMPGAQINGVQMPGSYNSGAQIPVTTKAMRNQQDSVLFGDELKQSAPDIQCDDPVMYFKGFDNQGVHRMIPISNSVLSRHFMLIGGIGTGKTNAFFQMLSQLNDSLTQNDVMIIFDTKGDFYKEFYKPGDVVISNDETAVGPDGKPDYWNIFNEVATGEQQYASVLEIAKSLFKEACEKTNQVFFPNAARDIFMSVMLHFLRYAESSGDTRFLNNDALIDFVKSRPSSKLREMLNSYPDMRAMTSYISSDESPQTQGVLSEMQQIIRDIFVGNFCKKGNLGLRDLVRAKGGRKIFIEYDLSYGEMLTPIYSLMFDMAIKEALGRGRSEGNVYFITDEFRLLPNLEHVDDAVNFGRSLGIRFMIGIQNVEQIYDNYGEERAHSIMSGFLTSLNFRVNDPKSRDFIKEQFGRNRKIEVYATSVQSKGMIEERRDGYVVEDWDVKNLNIGQAIIGFPEHEPFVFQFDLWNA